MKQRIIIPGDPISKRRPRFSRHGKYVVTYSDQKKDYDRISAIVRTQYTGEITIMPVIVFMVFKLKRPKSHYGTGKNSRALKISAPVQHVTKPDIDNCAKWIMDILTGIVWEDDAQAVKLIAEKRYSEIAETIIEIEC